MNKISITSGGKHPNGKDVYIYTLTNDKGTEVQITNYGAIIMSVKLRKEDGTFNDIVLGFEKPEQYWAEEYLSNYPYYGAAIGRYGNRIGPASITIDGETYKLNSASPDFQLHGGKEGFDKKIWDFVSDENDELVLQYVSPDGEEGFPGELTTQIMFRLSNDNELSYEYKATTNKPTVVNLTHHSYFNLNDGQGTIDNTHIKIYSSKYLQQDSNYTVTGNILDVKGTRNDFTEFKETGKIENPEKGIDISYPLDKPGIENKAAEAYCDEQDVMLEIYTTEPLIHLYNAYGSPSIRGKRDKQYTPFSAFCLETQKHPNSVNVPGFPNTILRPGELYSTKTVYKITRK